MYVIYCVRFLFFLRVQDPFGLEPGIGRNVIGGTRVYRERGLREGPRWDLSFDGHQGRKKPRNFHLVIMSSPEEQMMRKFYHSNSRRFRHQYLVEKGKKEKKVRNWCQCCKEVCDFSIGRRIHPTATHISAAGSIFAQLASYDPTVDNQSSVVGWRVWQ